MSEDYQWRQLGSIVNAVLLNTRTQAIRKGMVCEAAPASFVRKIAQPDASFMTKPSGNGFLGNEAPAVPAAAQLELPFGIAASSHASMGVVRSPRGVRLM